MTWEVGRKVSKHWGSNDGGYTKTTALHGVYMCLPLHQVSICQLLSDLQVAWLERKLDYTVPMLPIDLWPSDLGTFWRDQWQIWLHASLSQQSGPLAMPSIDSCSHLIMVSLCLLNSMTCTSCDFFSPFLLVNLLSCLCKCADTLGLSFTVSNGYVTVQETTAASACKTWSNEY